MTSETSASSDEITTHRSLKRFWLTIRDEPLIHFALLAALLFVAQALWAQDDREVISVDIATQDFLIKQKEDLLLRPLTAEEKEEVIASYVEDEMLVREARRRGFNNSSRVRALLIQNMRYFYSSDLAAPDESELRAFSGGSDGGGKSCRSGTNDSDVESATVILRHTTIRHGVSNQLCVCERRHSA